MCILHYITYLLLILRQTIHSLFFFFFFNDTATTEIYTLSLHDALPISLLLIGLLFFLRPGSARSEIKHAGIGSPGERVNFFLAGSHRKGFAAVGGNYIKLGDFFFLFVV